jgi:hypothetical protein
VTQIINTPTWPCDHFSFPSKPKPDVIDAIFIDGLCPLIRGDRDLWASLGRRTNSLLRLEIVVQASLATCETPGAMSTSRAVVWAWRPEDFCSQVAGPCCAGPSGRPPRSGGKTGLDPVSAAAEDRTWPGRDQTTQWSAGTAKRSGNPRR